MTLEPGQKLHHYELIEVIGKGGMGVVWRARDTSLRREVALKLLTPGLVDTSELRHRFLREARAAAAISHPHIATVFEVGEFENQPYIAMELVKGDTLRSRIDPGALPIGDALGVVCEVADGLTHAHRSGVIHRDLKPENVMIGEDGHVRILDFGLAKITEPDPLDSDPAEAKTITERLTRLGKVMGTAAYMSPEQARGQKVDARTDVFSFGAVLYESVTGQLPFRGATPLDTLTAVINNEPRAPSLLNERIPPELERIVRKCLQKKPNERYQDTGDLLVDLRQLRRETESQPLAMPPQRKAWQQPRVRRAALWGAVLAVVFYGALQLLDRGEPAAPTLPLIDERQLTHNTPGNSVGVAIISRDGRYLAYTLDSRLLVKVLDTGEIKDLTDQVGEHGVYPCGWYPDGTSLVFTHSPPEGEPSLRSVSIVTGTVRTIRDASHTPWMGSVVSPDGRTLAFLSSEDDYDGIWLMDADGSRPRQVATTGSEDEAVAWWVRWSPDSQRILYRRQAIYEDGFKNSLETCDLEGENRTVVLPPTLHIWPGIHAVWSPDYRIIFARTESQIRHRDNNLWAIDVDPDTGESRGEPQRLTSWYGYFSTWMHCARSGEITMARWRQQSEVGIAEVDRPRGQVGAPVWQSDDMMDDVFGDWHPDGGSFVFCSNRRGSHDVYRTDAATGNVTPLVTSPVEDIPQAITGDGKWLIYATRQDALHVPSLAPWTLHRVALVGGSPVELGTTGSQSLLACGREPGSRCVQARYEPGRVRFFEFDVMSGGETFLAEHAITDDPRAVYHQFSLSPDGRRAAWREYEEEAYNRVVILDLDTAEPTVLAFPDTMVFGGVRWDAGGEALASRIDDPVRMLRIGLDGSIEELPWEGNPRRIGAINPSPDGRRLVYSTTKSERTVWMVSGY